MEKLKPCPFCGSTAEYEKHEYWPDNYSKPTYNHGVGCTKNMCILKDLTFDSYYATEEEVITTWNTRSSEWISVSDGIREFKERK